MPLELDREKSGRNHLIYQGNIADLADGKVFDQTKLTQALQEVGMVTGQEEYRGNRSLSTELRRLSVQYRTLGPGDVSEIGIVGPVSTTNGAFTIDCYAVVPSEKEGKKWTVVKPNSEENPLLFLALYHTMAQPKGYSGKHIHKASSVDISHTLRDVKQGITGDDVQVVYESWDHRGGVVFGLHEAHFRLSRQALEIKDWCVENFDQTFRRILSEPTFQDVVRVYKHLKSMAWDTYQPREDLNQPRPEGIPLERNKLLVTLVHEHYKPALENAVEALEGDPEMRNFFAAI